VKNFIEDIIRFGLSPWLFYDFIDEYTHDVFKQRLVMRSLTHDISEANQNYMNWPPHMWQENYSKWAYFAGTSAGLEYQQLNEKVAFVRLHVKAFPGDFHQIMFNMS
jgi:hypothetical protein